jgi:hypothetical protein
LRNQGSMLWFKKKYFRGKFWWTKSRVFFAQTTARFFWVLIKTPIFSAENWQQSPKIAIITKKDLARVSLRSRLRNIGKFK